VQVDEAIAMRASSYGRPLTMANVEKHLEDVGLDREFGSHMRIRALSGGQKVKVVLAAAMWNCPHLLILDEPTNVCRGGLLALIYLRAVPLLSSPLTGHRAHFILGLC
jgi:ABC-type Mn2+/Zn2+ transport system ATPase subunit